MSNSLQPHGLYSLTGSSVYGISQARILEWVAIFFSQESSWSRDWIQVSCIGGGFFTYWATSEACCCCSVIKSCPTFHAPVDCNMPGLCAACQASQGRLPTQNRDKLYVYVACIFKGNMGTDYVHTQLSGWWMSQRSNRKLWLWCRQCLATALSDAGCQGNGMKDIISITKVCE